MLNNKYKVAIVGGAGHIGVPLSCFISSHGNDVIIIDTDTDKLKKLSENIIPFKDDGLQEYLKIANKNNIKFSDNIDEINNYELIIITLGTSSSKGDLNKFQTLMSQVLENINKNSRIILRSTITNETIEFTLNNKNFKEKNIKLAYCPERIAEGSSLKELKELPQIIGTQDGIEDKYFLLFFKSLGIKTLTTDFKNAVFLKLFTNSYRYSQFTLINEFSNIAEENQLDFEKIIDLATLDYPRLKNIPSKGFVGGPCLIKDTETFRIEYSEDSQFLNSLRKINTTFMTNILNKCNEIFIDKKLIQLGLTFKPNSDDLRDSLSLELYFNLKKMGFDIYPIDENVSQDSVEFELYDFEDVSKLTNNVLISTFHTSFKNLDLSGKKVFTVGNK